MTVSGTIKIGQNDLNLKLMLEGGQCFRWKNQGDRKWIGVASKILWTITQAEDHIEYLAKSSEQITASKCREYLNKYLRLNEELTPLYEKWSKADENFARVACHSPGLRMLDQDPVENLFSFICSSNNNIARISSMVEKLCTKYGKLVADHDGRSFHAFPTIEQLAVPTVEGDLRAAGFGYRAKYIRNAAARLLELGGLDWLSSLASRPYSEAKQELQQLEGIGPKVADCICLMSLGHLSAVPVDTHVFQIAAKHYLPHLRQVKTCSAKSYKEISDCFLELYGPYAGWAHSILFCAELAMFKEKPGKAADKSAVRKSKSSTKRKSGSKAAESAVKEDEKPKRRKPPTRL